MMNDSDFPQYVEIDPTGRYGRYNEILGKGASNTVAFDEYEGREVAWNQVKLYDFLQSSDDLERLYCEIHLLKTLKHKNIMKFYASWVDISKRNINFVTEMFTSGTVRQYRQMHKRVHIRAVKHWCRQILVGLLYLHGHDPPIIHRDLKCDNIFINGNQGEVKIGNLGLAAILCKSHAVHCIGTPEFMAPEVYEEEYNELVDIYSFGMCVLEMVTFEYPYSECTHPAQIYKKVISGVKPDALYRVKDYEARQFIVKCLATVSQRLSARELLMDPFLQNDDLSSGSWEADVIDIGPISREPSYSSHHSSGYLIANGSFDNVQQELEMENDWEDNSADFEKYGIDLFVGNENENEGEDGHIANVDITIKGRKGEDGGIFIRLRIGDNAGRARNIYFPFDIDIDTALGVAAEMVEELDITDYEVTKIADMIDGEVSSLVPEWKTRMDLEESSIFQNTESNISSGDSHLDYHDMNSCAINGHFEERTYSVEESPMTSSSVSEEANDGMEIIDTSNQLHNNTETSPCNGHYSEMKLEDSESKISQDPKWMRAMYQKKVKEVKDWRKRLIGRQRAGNLSLDLDKEIGRRRAMNLSLDLDKEIGRRRAMNLSLDLDKEIVVHNEIKSANVVKPMKSFHLGTHFSFHRPDADVEDPQGEMKKDVELEKIFAAKSYYVGDSMTNSLPETRSLCI